MWMAWGPELTFFCNAAYRRDTLGSKYPWALGRPANEVWAEVWDDVSLRVSGVLGTGKATWDEALLLVLERSGYPEETYHTFSYSPLRDGDAVVGMLCVVREDTERVIAERRMATLRDLGSDPGVARTEEQALAFAARQLARNTRDLPFTLTYLFDEDGGARLAGTTGIAAGHPAAPARLPGGAEDPAAVWPAGEPAASRRAVVALDGPAFAGLPTGGWPSPPDRALVVPLLRQGGAPYGFLVAGLNPYRRPDEATRAFVELVASHLAAVIASARSYREQARRAEELAELDRVKTAFFSNVSHEFRTPLALIMGPAEELRARLAQAAPELREEVEVIRRNGLRLGRLVNTLLDFSRIEAGRLQARYEAADLAALTAELAGVFRSAVERAGLTFEVDCRALPQPVFLDRAMWEKVVLNLLSNALKFTFDGGIRITVRDGASDGDGDGEAVVTVADTGTGLPEREIPRLFERFHRRENARSRSGEGSGIGLALVRELVGLHGGTIGATSVEGEGTTFTVRMPYGHAHLPADAVAEDDGARPAGSAAEPYVQEALRWLPAPEAADGPVPPPGAVRGGPVDVVVADDNADMREYLTRLLRGAGHRVRTAADGRAALEEVRSRAPDLLVADVMMPVMDGLRMVATLRAGPRTSGVPVLLLSARAGQEASVEGLEAGADDYLVKPFSAAEFLARVRANVELARLRTRHARWRTALTDSMQDAFFVCDKDGAVVEINPAFADLLGYGPEGLPYPPGHPWWPDAGTDPEDHRQVAAAFTGAADGAGGARVLPLRHRDGRRLWVSAGLARVQDPDSGDRVLVGTLRDITAERYAIRRETAVAALTAGLSRADSTAESLDGALKELAGLWRARHGLAVLFPGGGRPVTAAIGPAPEWDGLASGQQAVLSALRDGPSLTPSAGGGGVGVRLEHPRGPLVLWLDLGEHRPFTDQDATLLSLLAGHLAQGLSRAHRTDQQRATALALQRAILGPSELPEGFAVRYEPAARPLEVGGDWYDTVALSDGRIGIVVGDCVGRGLRAAAVMGQLRSACRALLLQDPRPDRVLLALDRFAADLPGAMCTTVFCGVLDPASGELAYSSAGHPPGVLVHPDGGVRLLDEGRSTPLAVRHPTGSRPCAHDRVPPHATLLLYTDGLVERRRHPLTEGIDRAGSAVREGRHIGVEDLAARLMDRMAPPGGYDDDVALLLYRHPAPLNVAFPAEAAQLAPVRRALRNWLNQCALPPQTVQNVLVAVGEACANAVEHGHRDSPGDTVRLRAEARPDAMHLTVSDTGGWRTPRPDTDIDRGRGFTLMRALMQNVTVTSDAGGTTVALHTRISR
ncbi:SpoIIE family protein phosphatase [Streptomyces sp. NPDC021020]|uniref:SpoIIE family protein phosphatase n=1 Tax=Streptomyces sp. NPDC021020 TaxID=3365109 RepID=UPI003798C11B